MGIPLLNRFLKEKHFEKPNNECIMHYNFNMLRDKTIVVDMLIYMYRFKSENLLFEKIYEMCYLFVYYNINAVFIFDGKMKTMNEEKKRERHKCKDDAITKYDMLYKKVSYLDKIKNEKKRYVNYEDVIECKETMKNYTSTKTKITREEAKSARHLIRLFGFNCIRSDTEADILCCYYVNQGKAYGCFTEDMDLLVYGCKRIFKYMSLVKHTFMCYSYDNILKTIELDADIFRELCVLSGSEYRRTKHNIYFIYKTIKRNDIKNNLLDKFCYNDILKDEEHKEEIEEEYNKLEKVLKHYNLKNHEYLKYFDEYNLEYNIMNNTEIEEYLQNYNFVFV